MGECSREVEFAERLTGVEQQAQTNAARISELAQKQDALDSMATSMAVMAEKQNTMSEKVDTIDTKVTAIEQKPVKRMDNVAEQVIGIIVAAVVGFLLARFGL